jgi:alanyl-tRNA synthetase
MTSAEIRQSFLDFFREKQHTIVPSSSLLPDAPNLLFTNAGMNQFVPIFLGQRAPDVDKWPGAVAGSPLRAADTQKCIRAGGKHNDLEDVGLDTYHHTFFEMLGNWSFGDYFKKEAIDWAWELLVERWHFPKERLYATYFEGDDQTPADAEARDLWRRHLPGDHVLPGGRKDNFWMMGDTGPCGPCSEIHIDLTPAGDGGKLVNVGDARCIEIWNLVFIQFNANPDGSLTPLAAKHVDTGMGFERVCSMIQCTNGFKDFTRRISNYETDAFAPIFRELEKLSGKRYTSTLPSDNAGEQGKVDIAFRVVADHVRCLSFATADGILPSNEGRGYVLRRILRRAVRYGRNLGFHEPFFYKLVDVVAANFGDVFPELRRNRTKIQSNLKAEEESFNRTLDEGIRHFEGMVAVMQDLNLGKAFSAADAFMLYDTYGFPLDLTELMARERGMIVDVTGFDRLMEEQRQRARRDHDEKKQTIEVNDVKIPQPATQFIGYDTLVTDTSVGFVLHSEKRPDEFGIVLEETPFYAEMGGQVGDTGVLVGPAGRLQVLDTRRDIGPFVHISKLIDGRVPMNGESIRAAVDVPRRSNIQRHHTVTHLFHWALHEVVSNDARQRGSLVAPDHLRFDFNHPEKLSDQQIADIERLVNERIEEDARVWAFPMKYADVKGNPKIMQFFGDKYGSVVRVVQIGGHDKQLDGFSIELCGGTHTQTTKDIGRFKIMRESAVAAGIRRVEAACGTFAFRFIEEQLLQGQAEAEKAKARELEKELAKQRQAAMQSQAPAIAERLLATQQGKLLVGNLGDANAELLRAVIDVLKTKVTSGVVVLGGVESQAGTPAPPGKVSLICYVTADLVKQGKHAGKIVGALAKICGGGGGGKPDLAQAGGKQPEKLAEALATASKIIGS